MTTVRTDSTTPMRICISPRVCDVEYAEPDWLPAQPASSIAAPNAAAYSESVLFIDLLQY
jgi:hypothetical protein